MKIRICYACGNDDPVKCIRELNVSEARLLTRYRKKGEAFMSIRDSVEQKEPTHTWKYIREQILKRPSPEDPNVDEDIICYIVEDPKEEQSEADETGGWNTPSSNLSAHDESPEYDGVRV